MWPTSPSSFTSVILIQAWTAQILSAKYCYFFNFSFTYTQNGFPQKMLSFFFHEKQKSQKIKNRLNPKTEIFNFWQTLKKSLGVQETSSLSAFIALRKFQKCWSDPRLLKSNTSASKVCCYHPCLSCQIFLGVQINSWTLPLSWLPAPCPAGEELIGNRAFGSVATQQWLPELWGLSGTGWCHAE